MKFKIIGDGRFRTNLIELAKQKNVFEHCNFLGKIPDHKDLEKEIASCAVALAPYIKELDKFTYYADPGKIKTYLACGVPVILTDIPWNAKEVEEHKCGKIIEKKEDIVESVLYLMEPDRNQVYRNNAVSYAKRFDYKNIFEDVLEHLIV